MAGVTTEAAVIAVVAGEVIVAEDEAAFAAGVVEGAVTLPSLD